MNGVSIRIRRWFVVAVTFAIAASGFRTSSAAAEAIAIEPGSWTLAILPDTQIYAQTYPQHFNAQTQWIADHAQSHNIKYVLHEGDITNRNTTTQWDHALVSMNILNGVVPYAMAPGNHDYGPGGNAADRVSYFNQAQYFGAGSAYAKQACVGGFFESDKTDNSYHTFSAGGKDWLVIALEWAPRDEVVDWANQMVADHPDHHVMLVTHAYMYYDETRYDWATKGNSQAWNPHSYGVAKLPDETANDGEELWDKLISKHKNFRLIFNGHVLCDGTGFLSSVGDDGNVVHQMLANYQMKAEGGLGDMRLLEFKEDGETVVVRTYSPVLDRYDTAYDQEFTLNMNEVHPPLSPPVILHAVGANIVVTGPAAPTDNTVDGVTVSQSGEPPVTTLQVNRGDYQVAVGGAGLKYQQGVLLASVTENVRNDIRASVEAGRSSFGDGVLALSVTKAGAAKMTEVNLNTAVAWFDFRAGWRGAHVNADGTIAVDAANGVEQSMLAKNGAGRYELDLGVDSRSDGLLVAIASNNSNIVVQTGILDDGKGWDIRVQSNVVDSAATGLDRDFSFVYLPLDTPGLVGGIYDGDTDANAAAAGEFTMNRLATGKYELSIPDESPKTGMLLLAVAKEVDDDGARRPDDNLLTYQVGDNETFLINSYDLPEVNLEDSAFAWAFIRFADPLKPAIIPGDYNRDGMVDLADHQEWKKQFGKAGELSADGNGDGHVDAADYTIWRENATVHQGRKGTRADAPAPTQ